MSIPEKTHAAIARYQAMAGQIKDLPLAAARRARADQKRHAERYVTLKRGKAVSEPLKITRFLVEICGLSLQEAVWAVWRELEKHVPVWEPQGQSATEMAQRLYKATGDVMEAVALARFYGWMSWTPDYWIEVRNCLVKMTVTEEATGIENWLDAAE
jgi:hypothetical protein